MLTNIASSNGSSG